MPRPTSRDCTCMGRRAWLVMGLVLGCEEPEPAGVSLADVAGEWRAAEPLAMERPDSLRVGEDGTGTAILVWQMMGSLWEVELDVAFEVGDDDFDATFTCTGDD